MNTNWFLGGSGVGSGMMYSGYPWFAWGTLLIALWSIVWKGLALWHAARRGEKWWFVALLVINTAGILEIVYLLFVARAFGNGTATTAPSTPRRSSRRRR